MRFRPKARRKSVPMRRDINFEDYSWDTQKTAGWHPLVVLNAKDKPTSKGDDMWVIDFGVELPDEAKGRIRWNVPETFPPKQENMQEVLLAEFEDEDGDFDLDPKVLMFRECVGLIEIDAEYQRDDGEPQWQLVKIIKTADAEAQLGADWLSDRAAGDDERDADDGDVFGGDDEPAEDPPY